MSASGSRIYVPRHRKGGKKVIASTQLDKVEVFHILVNTGFMFAIVLAIMFFDRVFGKAC